MGGVPPDAREAAALFAEVRELYARAPGYFDRGALYLRRIDAQGQEFDEGPIPYAVAFARPNRLRLAMFQAEVACDGRTLQGRVAELPQQVYESEAPRRLTTAALQGDEIVRHALRGGLESLGTPRLELLWGEFPDPTAPPRLLPAAALADRDCQRLELQRDEERFVLWIDRETRLVRRIDLPGEAIHKQIDPQGEIHRVEVWLDLNDARLEPPTEEGLFQLALPAQVRRLRRLVPPVGPAPQRLGEEIGPFEFVDLAGNPVDRRALAGKIVVVDFWFTTCGWCRAGMPALEKVYQKFKDDRRVTFLAVSTDPPQVDAEQLRSTLASWNGSLPIVRDSVALPPHSAWLPSAIDDVRLQSRDIFGIPGSPCLFLLDGDARIHHYQVGYTPDLRELELAIEGLLAGEDVARAALQSHAAEQRAFETELAAAAVETGSDLVEVPQATIGPRGDGNWLKLVERWRADDVKQPANILVVEGGDDSPRLAVLDGFRTVVEFDLQGRVTGRHDLDIPERSVVSFLRSAVDGAGRRSYVASAVSQQQLHVFDSDWKRQLSFPEGRHAGIADVQLADVDADGKLEMIVGYWGVVGVQSVALDGRRLWTNRSLENVTQVAFDAPDEQGRRASLCVNMRGTILPIDHAGEEGSDIRVTGRVLTHFNTADVDGDGQLDRCGLAVDPDKVGQVTAVGIDAAGKELWNYALPRGYHETLIERIVPARLSANDGGWVLPAADGSIHLLTSKGELVDRFHYGSRLQGLALARHNGKPLLIVAAQNGLAAWGIEKKQRTGDSGQRTGP